MPCGKLLTMSDDAQIPLTRENTGILTQCRNAFCYAVNVKFGCTAIFHNLGSYTCDSGATNVAIPDLRYSITLPSGVKISVWKDDLTCHQVDAVVNAANELLSHGGGLALALSQAGGPIIQKMSDQIITQYGTVPTGEAAVTPSGNLPCKGIIHAVGPCLKTNPTQSEIDKSAPLLHKTIHKILQIVFAENFQSVAIPALSSGLFNFPRHLCADIIVNVIRQVEDYNGFKGRNLEIRLVNNDEPSVQEMERACKQILGESNTFGSYSGAVKGRNQSMTSSSSISLEMGNVTLHLKNGCIEEDKADVIVNTISGSCDLSMGEISKALLRKAGRKIQEEINRSKSYLVKSGAVFETKGYDLNCKAVFHAVCASRAEPNATKILNKVVIDCLNKAEMKYRSISFPAIGTGHLGFPKHEVAKIMIGAVTEYAKHNMKKKVDIHFVVFPKDDTMMKAFEQEIIYRKGGIKSLSSDMKKDSASGPKETSKETPTVELRSLSDEAAREARAWIFSMLNPSDGIITINNNHVINLGQRDHENLLSLQTKFKVRIKEFFDSGHGGMFINGDPPNVSCAAFEVEAMLCHAQEEFAQTEEIDMLYSVVRWHSKDIPHLLTPEISAALEKAYLAGNETYLLDCDNIKVNLKSHSVIIYGKSGLVERTCLLQDYSISPKSSNNSFYNRTPVKADFLEKEVRRDLQANGLCMSKVEKIENVALKQLFEVNGKRVGDKPKRLYQRVSAQFCDLICRIGFQKEYSPPTKQKYGNGIYFSSSVDEALKLWSGQFEDEQYIYIIQAQVLTGKSTTGSQDLILPPLRNDDPLHRYDSVSDSDRENMRQIHVIFSGYQALPEYLIICHKSSQV